MHSSRNLIDNSFDTIVFNIGNFLYLGSQWLISIALVRLGGFEDAGYFSLAMSICSVFFIVSSYGIRTFQVSDVKNRFSDFTYIATRIFTIIVAFVLCVAFTLIKSYDFYVQTIVWFYMLYKSIEAYSDVLNGIWQKNEGMKSVAISLGSKGILNTVFFIGSYISFHNLFLSLVLMAISSAFVLLFYDLSKTKKFVNQNKVLKNVETVQVHHLLKQGFLAMLSTMGLILFNSIPKLVIEDVLNTESLGIFSSIATPSVVISTFSIGVLLPIAPQLAKNYENDNKKQLLRLICGCNFVAIGIGLTVTVFSAIAGRFIFAFIFGREILPYFNLFYCMIWVSVLISINNCYTTFLIAVRKLKPLLLFVFMTCIVECALCIILIKEKSIYGAGYAMLLTLILQFVSETIYIIYILNKKLPKYIK